MVIFLDWSEQFCHIDGNYRTAGYAWNDSFHNVTQTTSAVKLLSVYLLQKTFSCSHAVETDFILLDLTNASNTDGLKQLLKGGDYSKAALFLLPNKI